MQYIKWSQLNLFFMKRLPIQNIKISTSNFTDQYILVKKIGEKGRSKNIEWLYNQKTNYPWKALKCLIGGWRSEYSRILLLRATSSIVWVKTNDNNNCPFYNHFWPFFRQLYVYLSQKGGSDGHFEVLNGPKSWLVQTLWPLMKMEASSMLG